MPVGDAQVDSHNAARSQVILWQQSQRALGKGQFATEGEAKTSCPTDAVVWVNLRSKVYHLNGSASYGRTKRGAYMCERETAAAGYKASSRDKRATAQ